MNKHHPFFLNPNRFGYELALIAALIVLFGADHQADAQADSRVRSHSHIGDAVVGCASNRLEAQLQETIKRFADASQANGNTLLGSVPPVFQIQIFTDDDLSTGGLVGSYLNESLRDYSPQDDWRVTQTIAGTRIDNELDFTSSDWGDRSEVGVTGGTDSNWDNFSVQWDGFLVVTKPGMRIRTRSDDGSRMWIDLNQDGTFDESGNEFLNNGWGNGQAATSGPISPVLPLGTYAIRIQYEEGTGGNTMQLLAPPHVMRVAYLIPSNRTPQPNGVANLQWLALRFPEFMREQMNRNGFGNKSIQLELEADGVTPKIHVLMMTGTDDYYRADDMGNESIEIWDRVLDGASEAGVGVFAPGELWLFVYEGHQQQPDGLIKGRVALGAGFGDGSTGGVGLLGGERIPFFNAKGMTNNQPYDGLIIEEIGPHPLVQDVSFAWFEGTTISGVGSSAAGAAFHEVTHGLGVPHDLRNDDNFSGNMMGNGLRGFRGYFFPYLYPDDEMRAAYATCLRLSSSRYLQDDTVFEEDTDPTINSFVVNESPVDGLLELEIDVSDDSELAAAIIRRDGNSEAEIELAGSTSVTTIRTSRYNTGVTNAFRLTVYDEFGNQTNFDLTATPVDGFNRAPEPFVRIRPTFPRVGETVNLNASLSMDQDHNLNQLLVEWDLDNDGVFDTAPVFNLELNSTFVEAGPQLIRVRLTDPVAASSVSTPIAIDVVLPGDINGDGSVDLLDVQPFVDLIVSGGYLLEADVNGDGEVNLLDVAPFIELLLGN